MRGTASGMAVAVLLVLFATPASPAAAAPTCGSSAAAQPDPGPSAGEVPWPQRRYEPQRLAGIADGAGVVVAVLDSGVEAAVTPLRGRVLAGTDELAAGDGQHDCVGHGTAVASIIAAAPSPTSRFAGLAPQARILPVRITEREDVDGATGHPGSFTGLASGLRWAVAHGARIINLSLVVYQDVPELRDAIADAVRHDVVIVAAVGNRHGATAGPDQTPYPAAYPGVLGVGSIGPDGQRVASSPLGPFVDIVAPGGAVPALTLTQGVGAFTGTSFAAPFVSATAALIRQQEPTLPADQVAARILGTADPAPDGRGSDGYGYGVLNPYRAVTEQLATARPVASPVPVGVAAPVPVPDGTASRAVAVALYGGGLTGLILLGAVIVPRGARRGWRPGNR